MKGIDVSHYQGTIDFRKVKAAGYGFAILKATEGTYYKDPSFETNYKAAKAAGLLVGAYHFAAFTSISEAVQEAKYFQSALKGKTFDIIPQLDLEQNHAGGNLIGAMKAFFGQLGPAGLYSFASFYLGSLADKHTQPLWYARYASHPIGVSRYAIWQYSSQGRVPGINGYVDLDVSGTDFDLMLVPKPVAKSAPVKPAAVKTTPYFVTADKLYIRQTPGGKIIGELSRNDQVQVITVSSGWAHLLSAGKTVYVASQYLSQKLTVQKAAVKPVPKPALKPAVIYHIVAAGDTVGKLAAHYGVSINQIKSWNHLDSHYTIYLKQKIRVK